MIIIMQSPRGRVIIFVLLLLAVLVSCVRGEKAPADDLLQELDAVEESLERSEASAQQAEEIRAGVCGTRVAGLTKDIARVQTALSGKAPVNVTDDEVDKHVAAINSTADRKVLQKQRAELAAEIASQREMYEAVENGFNGDNVAFALAANARAVAEELQAAHAARYDSYARTLEAMIALIEGHFAAANSGATSEAETSDGVQAVDGAEGAVSGLNKAAGAGAESLLQVGAGEVPAHDLEWQSIQAQQLYAQLVTVVKEFDSHQAMERAMEKEAIEAWQNAAGQREQESKESMHLLKRLEQSMREIEQRAQNIDRQLHAHDASGTASAVPVTRPRVVLAGASAERQQKRLASLQSELSLWKANCDSHAHAYTSSRDQRQEMLRKIRSAKSMILDKVVRAKSITDSTLQNATASAAVDFAPETTTAEAGATTA